jgi:hypothetical protein
LAGVLDEALTAFLDVLDRKTLADALEPRQQLVALLSRALDNPTSGPTELAS